MKSKTLLLFFQLLSTAIIAQQTSFKGFMDLNYSVSNTNNHFALGEYDQFVQSQITDHISFLGEAIFTFDEESFEVYVMRAIATYEVSNYFKVSLGRHHTPI